MMPRVGANLCETCSKCNFEQPLRTNKCLNCGSTLTKARGRPVGTTVAGGYKVGPARHNNTTIAAGYNASSGHPMATIVAAGYLSGGRT